jgi:hypothetical protein
MSQIVVCRNRHGIVLAADSGSIEVGPGGQLCTQPMQRLHWLTAFTALLAGGGKACEKIAMALKAFIARENLKYLDEVYLAALPFLASEYESFMRSECAQLPVDPIHHTYFVLAGFTASDQSFGAHLIWNKKRRPLLDSDTITSAYAVPRRLGLEARLNRLAADGQSAEELLSALRLGLERHGPSEGDLVRPLVFAIINREGVREMD